MSKTIIPTVISETIVPSLEEDVQSLTDIFPSSTAILPTTETVVPVITGCIDDVPVYESYIINGVQYDVVSLISSQSGEAKVFHVKNSGNDYALKIYKPRRHPNHAVLDAVMNVRGNGLLIDIYAHGIWKDGNNDGYDFELMQYCSGSSLATVKLNGDEKKLKEIAVRMAAAIDFCHKHHILHRDIKPANFLYVDNSQDLFVLTDFGIGKMLDERNRTTTDEGRTPIYAAPEMYTYIPGKQTYVMPAADFYAMGMSLLALWMGEGMLIADEVKLVKDKQEETLPYPSTKEMSAHMLSLIKALTRRNPDNRANMDNIIRWAKGEVIYKELDNDLNHDFRIVFNSAKNLIAHSSQELARMLWENQELAKDYLYFEQIEKWFREIDKPEIAVQIHNITENEYPGDRNAGLYATCLLLDQEMPYLGVRGNRVTAQNEIAKELFENVDEYVNQLFNPTHLLWVYFHTIGLEKQAKKYPGIIKQNAKSGIHQLCYELDSDLPYRMEIGNRTILISDFNYLFRLLADGTIGDRDIAKLTDDDFLVWISSKNKTLAGTAIANLKSAKKSKGSKDAGWLVAYSIGNDVGYDFRPVSGENSSLFVTINDLAFALAKEINGEDVGRFCICKQLAAKDFSQTRIYQYLYSRKKYTRQIEWIQYCMDIESVDNQRKYAPYTVELAQMKAVAGLLDGGFPLQIAGVVIKTLGEYEANKQMIDKVLAGDNQKQTMLQNWLAILFHEDPYCDYKKESYYDLVNKYLNYLRRNLGICKAACVANQTEKEINKAKRSFRNTSLTVRIIQLLVAILCFVPLLSVSIWAMYNLFMLDADVFHATMEGIGKILGLIVGLIVGFLILVYVNWLLGILAGWGAGALVLYLCTAATPIVPWILIALLVATLFLFGRSIFSTSVKLEDEWSNMDLDHAAERSCLGNAFETRYKLLPNLPLDYPICVYVESAKKVKRQIWPFIRRAIYMFIITIAVCGLTSWISSKDFSKIDEEKIVIAKNLDGTYTGEFDNRNATIIIRNQELRGKDCLLGTVTINYKTSLEHNIIGYVDAFDSEHIVFMLRNDDGTIDDQIKYDAQIETNESSIVIRGIYVNAHKGTKHNFVFSKVVK